jgi:hypothetical protein
MVALEDPAIRAAVCLDCHFGSARPGQFASHEIMAAGHPRLAFELDLFTSLQRHHDEDVDYSRRKLVAGGVKVWAIGQAMAIERQLALLTDPARGAGDVVPEPSAFDCRSCHRTITDDPEARRSASSNPWRALPPGAMVFNDENLIMLTAAARVVAPDVAERLGRDAMAFHTSLVGDRATSWRAAAKLEQTVRQLGAAFAGATFSPAQTRGILHDVLAGAAANAYTDYQGGAQAVMATDTLLSALVAGGQIDAAAMRAIRPDINRAYAAVRDANQWQPTAFRAAMAQIDTRVAARP